MKAWNVVSLTILLAIVGCTTTWQNMYGGSYEDWAYCIQQTTDGGYIVAGGSLSTDIPGVTNHGGGDCYIIKLDANGEL